MFNYKKNIPTGILFIFLVGFCKKCLFSGTFQDSCYFSRERNKFECNVPNTFYKEVI